MTALARVDAFRFGHGGPLADVAALETTVDRLEEALHEAADAEHAAFDRWQEAYGAYEVLRDETSAAWRAWTRAVA